MRIRKFNEEYDGVKLDVDYIKECLVELYDKYGDVEVYSEGLDDLLFSVDFTIDIEDFGDYGYNEDIIRYINSIFTDFIELATEAMDKVKIKYKDIYEK